MGYPGLPPRTNAVAPLGLDDVPHFPRGFHPGLVAVAPAGLTSILPSVGHTSDLHILSHYLETLNCHQSRRMRIVVALIISALLSGCTGRLPAPMTVQIGSVESADRLIGESVRGGMIETFMADNNVAYMQIVEKAEDNPEMIISVVVSTGQGASSKGSAVVVGDIGSAGGNSSSGGFISAVTCTARTRDGKIFATSSFGQSIGGGARFAPPNECGRKAISGIIKRIRDEQKSRRSTE